MTTSILSGVRWVMSLLLGIVMFGVGLFIALRPMMLNHAPLLPTRWLDMMVAFAFLIRGVINIRMALLQRDRIRAEQ